MAITLGFTRLVQCDFSPVINQISKEFISRYAQMVEYLQLVLRLKVKNLQMQLQMGPQVQKQSR